MTPAPRSARRAARPRGSRGAARALAPALALLACAPEDAPSRSNGVNGVPGTPGVVLEVDGLELRSTEVEPLARDIEELYPEYSTVHARRLALTNELLTRLALRAVDPEAWAAARAAAEAADPRALEPQRAAGGFRTLGLGLWSAARHLPIGEWSGPIELAGRFARVRLERRTEHADVRREELELALLEFPMFPAEEARARADAALDAVALEIVDPAWEEAVPESWKHRMRGSER